MSNINSERVDVRALSSADTQIPAVGSDTHLPSQAAQSVLKNTYRLLGMTLAFSGAIAATAAAFQLPGPGLLLTLAGYFGLLFLTSHLRNSAWGLVSVFALTGFMGYTLGPILGAYLSLANGGTLVALAAGTTAVIFFALSAYARSSQAIDMLRFGNFLMIGIITAFLLGLAAYFLALPMLSLAVSGIFVLLMSGLILFETQNIVRGGETNYIMATVTLFVAIYNLFLSLLQILGVMGGEDG
jgi:modulator of FtsH protease